MELHGNVLKELAQLNPEYKFVWYDTAALEEHAIEVRPFFFLSNVICAGPATELFLVFFNQRKSVVQIKLLNR